MFFSNQLQMDTYSNLCWICIYYTAVGQLWLELICLHFVYITTVALSSSDRYWLCGCLQKRFPTCLICKASHQKCAFRNFMVFRWVDWSHIWFHHVLSLFHTFSPSVKLLGSITIRYPRPPLYHHLGPAWDLTPNWPSGLLLTLKN